MGIQTRGEPFLHFGKLAQPHDAAQLQRSVSQHGGFRQTMLPVDHSLLYSSPRALGLGSLFQCHVEPAAAGVLLPPWHVCRDSHRGNHIKLLPHVRFMRHHMRST